MTTRAKFVLVDPSVAGPGGHYYEYAVRVLTAANERGFEPVLLANRVFETAVDLPWQVIPAFELDFWGLPLRGRSGAEPSLTPDDLVELRRRHSHAGLLWAIARGGPHMVRMYAGRFPLSTRDANRIGVMVEANAAAEGTTSGFLPAGEQHTHVPASPEARKRRYAERRARVVEAFRQRARGGTSANSALIEMRKALGQGGRQAESFKVSLAEVLPRVGLSAEDHVFIPTLAFSEMRGLFDLLDESALARGPTYHLLFRRDLYTGYADTFSQQEWQVHEARNAFAVAAGLGDRTKLEFYTDTESLTFQYNRLESVDFTTAPIPVKKLSTASPRDKQAPTVAYLGDARWEKGFHYLPKLVEQLRDRLPTNVRPRYRFHSFFGGQAPEVGMLRARALLTLQQKRGANVQYIDTPLSSEAYESDLRQADVILVPYVQQNYVARSSGVFAEALAAGVPVIVTAGTWMSAILDALSFDYHQRTLSTATTVDTRTAGELTWRAYYGRTDDRDESCLVGDDTIRVGNKAAHNTMLDVPGRATHLWLSFELPGQRDTFPQVSVAQQDIAGHELSMTQRVLGGVGNVPLSLVVPLSKNTRRLWIAFRNAFVDRDLDITNVRFALVNTRERVAPSAVGTTFAEGSCDTESAGRLAGALIEVFENYDVLSRTAAENAERWARFHSAESLVDVLVKTATKHDSTEPTRRFVAPWW